MIQLPLGLMRVAIGAGLLFGAGLEVRAADGDVLAGLRNGHPRLIVEPTTWTSAVEHARTDPLLATVITSNESEAKSLLRKQPSTYQKQGRRLLAVSRETVRRVLVLASAYRLTGDRAYLERAEREMLAISAFSDWNPSHFLDVAEMTTALALGYDWLYADLSTGARRTIRDAIVTKGLTPALDPKASHNGWQRGTNNWNQVCFGGMVLGSLAVGDEVQEPARTLLARARAQMSTGLKSYAPDGVYPEGPGYWSYGTSYSVLTFAALQTALGTDWGYAKSPGFLASAGAYLQMNGATGTYFNFSDCGEGGGFEPSLFWFARQTRDPGLVYALLGRVESRAMESRQGEASRFMPLSIVWWPESVDRRPPSLPLRWHGEGPNPIAIFRGSWTNPNALYLAVKGGSAGLSHAHMDAGSFVFELGGVRWARDLGSQDYHSLESKGVDLWKKAQDSQRWTVFRLNNRSHNTLTIDDQLHRVEGDARIIRFSDRVGSAGVRVDLTPVFAGQVKQAQREFRLLGDNGIVVQDELAGLKPGADVCWTMVTGAAVNVSTDGRAAILKDAGKSLELRVTAPLNAKVSVISAEPPADGYNAPNPGRRRIVVHAPAPADGNLAIVVTLERRDG